VSYPLENSLCSRPFLCISNRSNAYNLVTPSTGSKKSLKEFSGPVAQHERGSSMKKTEESFTTTRCDWRHLLRIRKKATASCEVEIYI